MSSEAERLMSDIQLDAGNLYREENITDLKVGSIRILTPIKEDGTRCRSLVRSTPTHSKRRLRSSLMP